MNEKNIQKLMETKQKELNDIMNQMSSRKKELDQIKINAIRLDSEISTLKKVLEVK